MEFNELLQQGIKFFQEKKMDSALENFKAALKLQPDNAEVKQMAEMLEKALELEAKQPLANEIKNRMAVMGITDIDKAIAEYSEELQSKPNDASVKNALASAYYIRGLSYTSAGDHAKSIEDYSNAIKNEPEYPLAFNKRGWANLEIGNYDQAIKDFEKATQFNPNDEQAKRNIVSAYMARGIAFDRKSDYINAIPDFEMVLKLDPNDNTARELLNMAKAELAKK